MRLLLPASLCLLAGCSLANSFDASLIEELVPVEDCEDGRDNDNNNWGISNCLIIVNVTLDISGVVYTMLEWYQKRR